MISWIGVKSSLLKALSLAKNRQGLVQVQRTVTKRGKTFIQNFWVSPGQVQSTDRVIGGHQNLPNGHPNKPQPLSPTATVPQAVKDVTNAYQSTFQSVADFFNGLRANAISWKDSAHAGINMMRAKAACNAAVLAGWQPPGISAQLMAAVSQATPTTTQQAAPVNPTQTASNSQQTTTQTTTTQNNTNLPSKAAKASQASKDKANDFYQTFNNKDDFYTALTNMGITWKTNAHAGINFMRAKEALSLHIENGFDPKNPGTATSVQPQQQSAPPTLPPPKDNSLLDVPANATQSQKNIIDHINKMTDVQEIRKCAVMGMVPEDDVSKDYIINTMLHQLQNWVEKGSCPSDVSTQFVADMKKNWI